MRWVVYIITTLCLGEKCFQNLYITFRFDADYVMFSRDELNILCHIGNITDDQIPHPGQL